MGRGVLKTGAQETERVFKQNGGPQAHPTGFQVKPGITEEGMRFFTTFRMTFVALRMTCALPGMTEGNHICLTTPIPRRSTNPCLMVFAVRSHSSSLVGLLSGSAFRTGQFV